MQEPTSTTSLIQLQSVQVPGQIDDKQKPNATEIHPQVHGCMDNIDFSSYTYLMTEAQQTHVGLRYTSLFGGGLVLFDT